MLVAVSLPPPRNDLNVLRAERRLSRDASPRPETPETPTGSRNRAGKTLKTTWKSFVQFFALPIREYYQEPPGLNYRQRQLERRRHGHHFHGDGPTPYDEIDFTVAELRTVPPCPVYETDVREDEMVLCRAESDEIISDPQVEENNANQALVQSISPEQPEQAAEESDTVQDPPSTAVQEASRDIPSGPPRPAGLARGNPSRLRPRSPLTWRAQSSRVRSLSTFGLSSSTTITGGSPMARQYSEPHIPSLSSDGPTPEPLNWVEMRSQYPYPKRGLTDHQQRFLSSSEMLGKYGVPFTPPSVGASNEAADYFAYRPAASSQQSP